ncbi:MAG: hypothetical protein WAT79_12685 [Saprospiraceae bacterium]
MKSFWNIKMWLPAVFLILGSTFSMAQKSGEPHAKMREKINTHKIAFLTDRMQLTEAEAEKFWPIYRAYEEDKKSLRQDKIIEKMNTEISEKEADTALNSMIEMRSKELDMQKKYIGKFRSVLSSNKVIRLLKAEKEFKGKMMEKIRDRSDKRGR